MKPINEWMSDRKERLLAEAGKKLLSGPEEIDASNPVVKKLLKACSKNGYKLKKAFSKLNAKGKPSGWFTISVDGDGPGYHPDIRYNMNGRAGEMFYISLNLKADVKGAEAKAYAEGLAKGVAMLEVLNGINGTELPGLLF